MWMPIQAVFHRELAQKTHHRSLWSSHHQSKMPRHWQSANDPANSANSPSESLRLSENAQAKLRQMEVFMFFKPPQANINFAGVVCNSAQASTMALYEIMFLSGLNKSCKPMLAKASGKRYCFTILQHRQFALRLVVFLLYTRQCLQIFLWRCFIPSSPFF